MTEFLHCQSQLDRQLIICRRNWAARQAREIKMIKTRGGSSGSCDSSNGLRLYPPLLAVGAFHKEPLSAIFPDRHLRALRETEMNRRVRHRGEARFRLAVYYNG